MRQAFYFSPDEQGYSVPATCNQTRPFLCPSPRVSRERFSCISADQIGDTHIDCAGAIDESNTLEHCSLPSAMLGYNFRCLSTNTCIPYWLHCFGNNRCPNQSDDDHWCSRSQRTSEGISPEDALCFNGRLFKGGRCNKHFQCPFWEDEYMCDYSTTLSQGTTVPYREQKASQARSASHSLRLSRYPPDAKITLLKADFIANKQSLNNRPSSSFSLSPFWCNRGLGALLSNGSIVCFCPPQYFGDKCQYQTNRVSVLLSLDLSQSIYHRSDIDSAILLKVLLLFLFNNQTLMRHEFHLRPALDITSSTQKKMATHFLYSHSAWFRQHRAERHNNRSSLTNTHPFSMRIEIYETQRSETPALVGVWRYPIYFDDLPVFRLAKVLRLSIVESTSHAGAVIQYFHLDSKSVCLILVHQQAVQRLSGTIEFYDD